MGFPVNDDKRCPIAIRHRHAETVLKAISNRIDEFRPLPLMRNKSNMSDPEEITASEFLLKPATATSSRTPAHKPSSSATTGAIEVGYSSVSIATAEISMPLCSFESLDTSTSLASFSRSGPELDFSIPSPHMERKSPSPYVEDNVGDCPTQEGRPKRNRPWKAMLNELHTTLKLGKPMPRPKPRYHKYYRISLPEDSPEDSDAFFSLDDGSYITRLQSHI